MRAGGSPLTSGADVLLTADRLVHITARALVALVEEGGASRADMFSARGPTLATAPSGAALVVARALVVDGTADLTAAPGVTRRCRTRAGLGQVCPRTGSVRQGPANISRWRQQSLKLTVNIILTSPASYPEGIMHRWNFLKIIGVVVSC